MASATSDAVVFGASFWVERDRERPAVVSNVSVYVFDESSGSVGASRRLGIASLGRLDGRALVGIRRDGLSGRIAVAAAAACDEREREEKSDEGAHGLRSYPPMSNVTRCEWATGSDELMLAYHDEEWGVPSHDDRHLFELLTLEGAQAGLSWSTILRKREGYRRAFAGFDPEVVARFSEKDVERLLADPGIVRNRLKVESTVEQRRPCARAAGGTRKSRRVPVGASSTARRSSTAGRRWRRSRRRQPLSKALSKDLKRRGFRFVGPTVLYAFMQSVGMVDDHTVHCFRRLG